MVMVSILLVWLGGLIPSKGLAQRASKPPTVASTSLASDEILWELLAHDPGRIVSLSSMARNPRYSNITPLPTSIPTNGANAEALVRLQPGIVFLASYNRPELVAQLGRLKLRTEMLTSFASLDDVAANIASIGRLTQTAPQAKRLLASFHSERKRLADQCRARTQKATVLSYNSAGTLMGRGTMFDSIVRAACGVNLAAKIGLTGWPKVSREVLTTLDPDVIVVGVHQQSRKQVLAQLKTDPIWSRMPAVRREQVVTIPEKELFATSHHVMKAVRTLHGELHAAKR